MMGRLIGVSAAARIIGVHRQTVIRWINEGALDAAKVTKKGKWRIDIDDVRSIGRKRESQIKRSII